jgi:hypothetical protein
MDRRWEPTGTLPAEKKRESFSEKDCGAGQTLLHFDCEMANTIKIPRNHLIMGVCLPLAVLVGYFMAEPLEPRGLAVIVLILSVLSVPLLMEWHHPILVLGWNAYIAPVFFPGRLYLWVVLAVVSLFFAVLNRSVNPQRSFIHVPSLTRSLFFLLAVVAATAALTGGISANSLGSAHFGGKCYVYVFGAVAGYFALTSRRIPLNQAGVYLAMFFLPGITSMIGDLVNATAPEFNFLVEYLFQPGDSRVSQDFGNLTIARFGSAAVSGAALYGYLLARYGIRGALDYTRSWRFLLLLLAAIGVVGSGFRGGLILFGLTLIAQFYFEGLHRTRQLPIFLGLGIVGAVVLVSQANRLPLPVQRTLSFLPVKVDPIVKDDANSSTEWRVAMWKAVLPEVPQYLFKGKGYSMDPDEIYMEGQSAYRGYADIFAVCIVTGQYHNGVLSILMPFGLFGMAAFIWFLTAALRVLYDNYRFGNPALRCANTFLLASFIARIVTYFCVFGSFYSDLFSFTGLVGLSVSLNGPRAHRIAGEENEDVLSNDSEEYHARDRRE